ncbi:hypothetical protein NE865_10512 [Phthorimaea operculella]|nr:hypothetical protein NE865_10512 [Phthorimaea operculella]
MVVKYLIVLTALFAFVASVPQPQRDGLLKVWLPREEDRPAFPKKLYPFGSPSKPRNSNGCLNGYCWMRCQSNSNSWCWTSDTYAQSFSYKRCRGDADCGGRMRCASPCTRFRSNSDCHLHGRNC